METPYAFKPPPPSLYASEMPVSIYFSLSLFGACARFSGLLSLRATDGLCRLGKTERFRQEMGRRWGVRGLLIFFDCAGNTETQVCSQIRKHVPAKIYCVTVQQSTSAAAPRCRALYSALRENVKIDVSHMNIFYKLVKSLGSLYRLIWKFFQLVYAIVLLNFELIFHPLNLIDIQNTATEPELMLSIFGRVSFVQPRNRVSQ